MKMIAFCLLLACLAVQSAQAGGTTTQFAATITISQDPDPTDNVNVQNVENGLILNYDYDRRLMSIAYPSGYSETYDWTVNGPTGAGIMYKNCDTCETYKANTMPQLFRAPDDTQAGAPEDVAGKMCTPFTKPSAALAGGVSRVLVDLARGGRICRAEFGTNKVMTFAWPHRAVGSIPSPPKAGCPNPTCAQPMDLVFVVDESGSINPEEWALQKDFVTGVLNEFTIGPEATQAGLVWFSGESYNEQTENPASCCGLASIGIGLSPVKANFENALTTHQKVGGHTCINCGIRLGQQVLDNPTRNLNYPKVMIVITDGYNNRETNYFARDILAAKQEGILMFAVGVANSDAEQLNTIASTPQGVFKVDQFKDLATIIKPLANAICQQFPEGTPCGALCKGSCQCRATCLCPLNCAAGGENKCEEAKCVLNQAGSACVLVTKDCQPEASVCKRALCDPETGKCQLEDLTCDDGNPCTDDVCDPSVGCRNTPKDCPGDPNVGKCVDNYCDPVDGQCKTRNPVNCDDNNKCTQDACDPQTGVCKYTPAVVCNDNNQCTVDSCDPATGNCKYQAQPGCNCPVACTNDPCNPQECKQVNGEWKCVDDPVNCDDKNPCTEDKCELVNGAPACTSTAKDCGPQPNNKCNERVCDGKTGECIERRSVDCDDGTECTTDSCDPNTGKCSFAKKSCVAENKCQTATCDSKSGCKVEEVKCDDGLACTSDKCDPTTGLCTHARDIECAHSGKDCFVTVCDDLANGCVERAKDCGQPKDECHVAVCRANECVQSPLDGAVDECGNCIGSGEVCREGDSSGGILPGVVAAVTIIAALLGGAFALAIGACLAKNAATGAGVSSAAPMGGANVNPLYEADMCEFENPLHSTSTL